MSGRSLEPIPRPERLEGVFAVMPEPESRWKYAGEVDFAGLGFGAEDRRTLARDGWVVLSPEGEADRVEFESGRRPPGARAVAPVFRDPGGGISLGTDRITVLMQDTDISTLHGLFPGAELRLNVCCPLLVTLQLPSTLHADFEAADSLIDLPNVERAWPEMLRRFGGRSCTEPFAPTAGDLWTEQWHWENTAQFGGVAGADVDIFGAWEVTKGAGIRIAVIENGFDLRHPELSSAVSWSAYFPSATGAIQIGTAALPCRSHGTRCAALAAAHPQAGRNISGAAPEADLLLVAIDGFTSAEIMARAICYAANPRFEEGVPNTARGAHVITSSRETPALPPPMRYPVLAAVRYARVFGRRGKGAPFIYPVSNAVGTVASPNFAATDWLASDPDVLAVGKIGYDDATVGHANGPGLGVVAPGYHIYTLKEGGDDSDTGTSFAAPIVAGIAALLIAANPKLKAHWVKSILEHTAEQVGPAGVTYVNGWNEWLGFGRVNATAAVTRSLQPPFVT